MKTKHFVIALSILFLTLANHSIVSANSSTVHEDTVPTLTSSLYECRKNALKDMDSRLAIIRSRDTTISSRPVLFGELQAPYFDTVKPHVWRGLLKDYFLAKCILEGFKDKDLQDNSSAIYFDIVRYEYCAFLEIIYYARRFIKTIKPSPHPDHRNKRAVILKCIDKYKSDELDKFIKSLDKYMIIR